MDKKAKNRVTVLRTRLSTLQQMLAGVKQQSDAPEEIPELGQQIAKTEKEMASLTGTTIAKR